jgi:poly-beta-1,6-N-acetyl-D-glucosamine biosynthesis protein PgaD
VLLWCAYLYLIRLPVAGLAYGAHAIGLDWIYDAIRAALPYSIDWRTLSTFVNYLVVIALNSAILLAWGRYNWRRFRHVQRRRRAPQVGPADLAALYAVPEAQVMEWQSAKRLVIVHDPGGKIQSVQLPQTWMND